MPDQMFTCRVCEGSGLLQHPGGPEYATSCVDCENENMAQHGEFDWLVEQLFRDDPSLNQWQQDLHTDAAKMLVKLYNIAFPLNK